MKMPFARRHKGERLLALLFQYCLMQVPGVDAENNNMAGSSLSLRKGLSGSHLRMSANSLPPWMTITRDASGNYTYRGAHVEACDFISRALNVTYSYVRVEDKDVLKYGNKEAALKLLFEKKVEIVTYGIAFSLDHYQRLDYSVPLIMGNFVLMVPWPEQESRLLAPIRPFQPIVWLGIIVTLVCMAISITWLSKFYHKFIIMLRNQRRLPLEDVPYPTSAVSAFTYLFSSLSRQSMEFNFLEHLPFKVLIGAFCLISFVIMNAYSGTLTSYLTVPRLLPVPKSLEDLTKSGQPLKTLVDYKSVLAEDILAATSGVYKSLGDFLRANPECLFIDRRKGFDMMYSRHYAYIAMDLLVLPMLQLANEKAGYCRLTVSTERLAIAQQPIAYMYAKHWRYTTTVNQKMLGLAELGLPNYWLNAYMPRNDTCMLEKNKNTDAQQKILSLTDLSSAFFLLGVGMICSLAAFIIELARNAIYRCKCQQVGTITKHNQKLDG